MLILDNVYLEILSLVPTDVIGQSIWYGVTTANTQSLIGSIAQRCYKRVAQSLVYSLLRAKLGQSLIYILLYDTLVHPIYMK